jgi:hypothetical protein
VVAKKTIESCPDEILIKIFAHLPTSNILLNVARVSMRFWRLSKLPMTHRNARLPDYADQRKVIEFLTLNKKVEDLTLVTKFKVKIGKVVLKGFDVELFKPLVEQKRLRSFTAHSFMCFNENNLISLLKVKSLEEIRIFNYLNIRGRSNLGEWSCEASNLKQIQIYCRPSR